MNGQPACRIYLLRHGETANAGEVCFNGHFDVDLSDRGKEQSRRLAEALTDLPVKAVYCSDLKRARLGAQFVSDPHKLECVPCRELRELSFGAWEGMSVDEVNRKYPDLLSQRLQNIETFCVENGESFSQLRDRVIPKFEEIVSAHPEDCIVILCHGGVIRTILAHILEIPIKNLFRVQQPYAAVNIIQYYEGGDPVVELAGGSCDNIHPPDSPDKTISIQ
ncbi:phosphoglycerate mutase [Candidatus Nitromaritima sp. SCGC AAA799-A02]|nr:phosphoglycerate mutase [Candidatus Nitromaritima sp. SCGC AAA799-A02]KMP12158.1 phosphoglycerate mutase [Candidatus Nitromaritima sp. SCGC AAA799-C22]